MSRVRIARASQILRAARGRPPVTTEAEIDFALFFLILLFNKGKKDMK
jgi:acid phosphatase class B